MAETTPVDTLKRYLQDAIAAEQNFESQLRAFASDAEDPEVHQLFAEHAEETRRQQERLSTRLAALGGRPSGVKSFLAHVFGMTPMTAQLGYDASEKSTQDLIIAFAAENSEVAMYEALAAAASTCGDTETQQLAREIQEEERQTAEKIWQLVAPTARRSFEQVTIAASAARRAA